MIKKFFKGMALLTVLFVTGCGVTHSPVPQAVTVDRLLTDGWNLYDAGNYQEAAAKFDSVINIDITNVDAHLGYAWSENMLSNFNEARSYFRILEIAGFGRTATPLKIDSGIVAVPEETSWGDTVYVLRVNDAPVLKISKIVAEDRSTYQPIYIGDDEIWLGEQPTNDTFKIYYFYYDRNVVVDSIKDYVAWGYSGYGASFLADESGDEEEAVYGLKAAIELLGDDTTVTFEHRPYLNVDKMRALEALAFFRWGLYKNTVDILVNYFGWDEWDPAYNPFAVDKRVIILRKLEDVLRNVGS